jgi:1-acyl-sn-glycerol-3-phosphate acyltransferase
MIHTTLLPKHRSVLVLLNAYSTLEKILSAISFGLLYLCALGIFIVIGAVIGALLAIAILLRTAQFTIVLSIFLIIVPLIAGTAILGRKLQSRFLVRCAHSLVFLWSFLTLLALCIPVRQIGQFPRQGKKPLMVSANHVSWLDMVVLAYTFRGIPTTSVSKEENFKIPLFGWTIRQLFVVPVKRNKQDSTGDRASVQHVKDMCEEWGLNLLYFHEGTRTPNGKLQKFHRGGFELPFDTVPVVMRNLFVINGKDRSFFAVTPFQTVTVVIGKIIERDQFLGTENYREATRYSMLQLLG